MVISGGELVRKKKKKEIWYYARLFLELQFWILSRTDPYMQKYVC